MCTSCYDPEPCFQVCMESLFLTAVVFNNALSVIGS